MGVSPSQWADGDAISGPSEVCTIPHLASATWLIREDTRTWQQISGSPSRWLISCWSLMNETSMLWYGELNNLTLILLNQEEITAMVQPQPMTVTTVNTNSSIASSVYLLSGSSTSLFAVDLMTHNVTMITVTITIDPFTLLEVNGTLIMAQTIDMSDPQPISSPALTLLLYNLYTLTWTTVTSVTSPCQNFTALTYDSLSATLTVLCGNALYSCRLSALNFPMSGDPLNCQPFFYNNNSSQSPSQIYYLRAGDQLFSVGANSAILAHTISNRDKATYYDQGHSLLDSTLQPDLCILQGASMYAGEFLLSGTLIWNDARQTLYVACSIGSAAAISIQSIRTQSPVITSLITTDICSQMQSPFGIGIGTSSPSNASVVTLLLQCAEGLFSTTGRSLNSISRLLNINPLFLLLNPLTHSAYSSVSTNVANPEPSTPTAPTLYQVTAVHVNPILTWLQCPLLSGALSLEDGRTWLTVCAISATTPPCVRQFVMDEQSGMLKRSPDVDCLFSVTLASQIGDKQPRVQTVYWTRYGWYLLSTPQILFWPSPRNNTNSSDPASLPSPIPVVMSSQQQLNLTSVAIQVGEVDDGTLVASSSMARVDGMYLISYVVIYHVTINDPLHPEQWNTSRLVWSQNYSRSANFVVEQTREGGRVWFHSYLIGYGEVLRCVDLATLQVVSIHEFGPHSYISALTLDAVRHRLYVAKINWDQKQSFVNIIDTKSGTVTQTVSPSNPATPYIYSMIVDSRTAVLTSILDSEGFSSQIVAYSEQWTCSAGMQWIDGSCEVCGMSTSRGFISYENATMVTPQCEPCAKGRYSNNTGESECRTCDPGRYSTATGTILCKYCQPNSYNNINGSTQECSPCPSGSEARGFGFNTCSACVLGQFTASGGPCEPCQINTYSPHLGATCLPCTNPDQEGLQCRNGLASVDEGWWAYQLDNTTYRTTRCPPGYCPGSSLQADPNSNSSSQLLLCQYPRLNSTENWLCAGCIDGFIPWGSSCEPCTNANVGLLTLAICVAILLVFFLLRASSAAGPVTILVFFIQVAALEVGPVTKWIDWIQFANFGAHSVRSCLLPIMPITQNILTMLIPLILFMILTVLCSINYRLSIYFASRDTSQSNQFVRMIDRLTRDFSIDRYIGCAMAILIFCYTSVTVTCIQSLHCVNVAPGIDRLFSAPTIDCNSHEYKRHLKPAALVFLILYVIGFPFAMFIFLWQSSPTIRELTEGQLDSFSNVASQRFSARWSHFYRPYRGAVWYWQPFAMIRRFAFALISVLLIESPSTKYVLYGSFGLFSFLIHSFLRPFIGSRLNHLESTSYLLLIYVAYLLTSVTPPFSISIQVTLFFLIVPFSLLLVGLILRMFWINLTSRLPLGRSITKSPSAAGTRVADEYTPLPSSSSSHRLCDSLYEN